MNLGVGISLVFYLIYANNCMANVSCSHCQSLMLENLAKVMKCMIVLEIEVSAEVRLKL